MNDVKYCFSILDKVSRSFASVIRQLPEDLSITVCIFYLVLRALDSIEDDMDCDKELKLKLLKEFHSYQKKENWTISGVGDKPEYRELLKNYDKVIRAFSLLDEKYQRIITDICKRMGYGMAEFIEQEIVSKKQYDLYCHYVAGLVGIGLSQLFVASGYEDEVLTAEESLSNSMGLFLQKTNIIRDYKEDLDEERVFWPEEIWKKYSSELSEFSKNPNSEHAISCLNELVNDVLSHLTDSLAYLKHIKNKKIFRFCAIPQVMALATLCKVFNNPKVFTTNVKIRKGQAAHLILNTNTYYDVVTIFEGLLLKMKNKAHKSTQNASYISQLIESQLAFLDDNS